MLKAGRNPTLLVSHGMFLLLTWHFPSRSLICSSLSFMSMVSFLHSVSRSRIRLRKVSVDSTLLDREKNRCD